MIALVIYSLIEVLLKRAHIRLTTQQFFRQLRGLILVQFVLDTQEIVYQIAPAPESDLRLLEVLSVEKTRDWVLQAVLSRRLNTHPPPWLSRARS